MRLLVVVLMLMMTGCATVPENYWRINKATSAKFTYVSDMQKHGVTHLDELVVTGDYPFDGDCEEYATAIRFQLARAGIPARRWVVSTKSGYHAITCTEDGWCFDAFNVPMRRENTPYLFITQM